MTDMIKWVAERVVELPQQSRPKQKNWGVYTKRYRTDRLGTVTAPNRYDAFCLAGKRWGGVGITVTSEVAWLLSEEERGVFAKWDKTPAGRIGKLRGRRYR